MARQWEVEWGGPRVVGWEDHGTYQGMSEFFDGFCMNILWIVLGHSCHSYLLSRKKHPKHPSPIGGLGLKTHHGFVKVTVGYSILVVSICHATAFTWCIILGDAPLLHPQILGIPQEENGANFFGPPCWIVMSMSEVKSLNVSWNHMDVPKTGVPQNGWFIIENPIQNGWFGGKTHHFWKHPY